VPRAAMVHFGIMLAEINDCLKIISESERQINLRAGMAGIMLQLATAAKQGPSRVVYQNVGCIVQ
jgi:hypothetical protein